MNAALAIIGGGPAIEVRQRSQEPLAIRLGGQQLARFRRQRLAFLQGFFRRKAKRPGLPLSHEMGVNGRQVRQRNFEIRRSAGFQIQEWLAASEIDEVVAPALKGRRNRVNGSCHSSSQNMEKATRLL